MSGIAPNHVFVIKLSQADPGFLCEEVITYCADCFHDWLPFWVPVRIFSRVDITGKDPADEAL